MTKSITESSIAEFVIHPRVCLPYGIELFDLCRWMIIDDSSRSGFRINSNADYFIWSGGDPIDLFKQIQARCLNRRFTDSFVTSLESESVYFFDRHERFSFFAANKRLTNDLFPFSGDVIWENFALTQEEDIEFSLRQIFDIVHTL